MAKKSHELKIVSAKPDGGKTRVSRGIYTGPLSREMPVEITLEHMHFIAEVIVKQVREEIRKDAQKARGFRKEGDPVPLPLSPKFAESFTYKIKGKKTIEIVSDWPTAADHTKTPQDRSDVAPGYKMTWLTRDKIPYAKIVQSDGQVVVRTTPDVNAGDAYWVHPGFKRYSFLERGIRKGKIKAIELLLPDLVALWVSETGTLFGG